MRSVLREPLVHLVVLGALLFGLHRAVGGGGQRRPAVDPRVIAIDDAFVTALAREHAARTGREPDRAGRRALVKAFVREEALYREARAHGLEAGDVIVRRRLVQKMEFLLEGTVELPAPTEAELSAWLRAHPEDHRVAPRVAFAHVFFARDRRRERAEADAREALAEIRRSTPEPERLAGVGDAFLLGLDIGLRDRRAIAGSFGDRFAAAVMELPVGAWQGPIESSYGFHLVRVTRSEPGRLPALAEVRTQVERAWRRARREEATQRAIERVVASYRVER
ncbi:MAG: peptidyl-prolyl cis-trans isomerase [Deltaproteobacteria bacterium]|nr:peptidyl-prolyl cis-trans isomerase [Deltaproteobacteria bacterium]